MFGINQETGSGETRFAEARYSEYSRLRVEYLDLCDKYNFSPRELSLLLMGGRHLSHSDKERLIQLIIQVSGLERELVDVIHDCLFAKSEADFQQSRLFIY